EKTASRQLESGFLFRADTSRSDFRSFESAPAASRRDKTSIAKLNLGFGSEIPVPRAHPQKTAARKLATVLLFWNPILRRFSQLRQQTIGTEDQGVASSEQASCRTTRSFSMQKTG
ncbi:MAG: hypothetical protein K2I62_07365, partial [Alistipes sp.]|nr:hypothetical protein [Alistipes sp.]